MIRLAFFFSALSLAAVMDMRTRTIPDWLVVLVALTSMRHRDSPIFWEFLQDCRCSSQGLP